MRFLIDVHHIGARATGNETWAAEVAGGMSRVLQRSGDDDHLLFAIRADARHAVTDSGSTLTVHGDSLRRLVWDLPGAARRERVNALLVQYTTPVTSTPTVAAIHDLSFTHPASREWIPPLQRARMRATIRWSASRADRVVALSRYTAMDLQNNWGISNDKIVVAYPAVGSDRARRLRRRPRGQKHTGQPQVLLAVGNILPRKNLLVLAQATRILRHRGLDVILHLVGQVPTAGRAVRTEIEHVGGEWVKFSGYASEDSLIEAYHGADVFCFPSLYEGFGLPVLEAMTAGVPTVVSDATALPEAAGDAGAIVDPHDQDAWADVLERVLIDDVLASEMRLAGLSHAARFDWDDTAACVLQSLRMVGS